MARAPTIPAERLNFRPEVFARDKKKAVEAKLTELSSASPESQIKFAMVVNTDGARLCDEALKMPGTDLPASKFITELSGNSIFEFLNQLHETRNNVNKLQVGSHAGDLDFAIMAFEDWIFAFRFSHRRTDTAWGICLITLSYASNFRYGALIDDVKALINGVNSVVV